MADAPMTRREMREQSRGKTERHDSPGPRIKRDQEGPVLTWLRRILGLVIVAAIPAMLVNLASVQMVESKVAAQAIRVVLGVNADVAGPIITVGLGSAHVFSMQVTAACSVVLLSIPLLLVAAAMLVSGRGTVIRTIPVLVVASAVLLAINAMRFVLIASMTRADGLDGFGWAHTFWGSLVALVGLTAVAFGYVYAVSARFRRKD